MYVELPPPPANLASTSETLEVSETRPKFDEVWPNFRQLLANFWQTLTSSGANQFWPIWTRPWSKLVTFGQSWINNLVTLGRSSTNFGRFGAEIGQIERVWPELE